MVEFSDTPDDNSGGGEIGDIGDFGDGPGVPEAQAGLPPTKPAKAAKAAKSEDPEMVRTSRDEELSTKEDHKERLEKVYSMVEKAYRNQYGRTDKQKDYWTIHACELDDNQIYNGNSMECIPLVHDAIEARVTRFANQAFPVNGRSVKVVSQDGEYPHAEMALIESYIRKAKMRTEVVPALIRNGDVEGQYNAYVRWQSTKRHVVHIETVTDETGQREEVVEEVVEDAHPVAEAVPDGDVVITPATADSAMEAIMKGGAVAITRRWTKDDIKRMVADGDLVDEAETIITSAMDAVAANKLDIKREHVADSGIKGRGDYYVAREVWHLLDVDDEPRLVRSYMGDALYQMLGTKLNPLWCDLLPIVSCAVKKLSGAAKGQSLIKPVAGLQYKANDFLNESCDSATYSAMPIVAVDPAKNPGTMVLDLAARWEVDPNSVKFMNFPALWEQGFEIISALKNQIQQSLGVNPSMIPATSGKSKRSQADIANEQAVDVLTTADSVTILEEGVLTPILQLFVGLDMQHRQDDLLIPAYGMMGKRAKMERIPPLQFNNRYEFQWTGVQSARNAAQRQQQTAWLNVVNSIPPDKYPGYRMNLAPFIEAGTEDMFGPELAPLIFVSEKDELSMPQEEENKYLEMGHYVPTSPMDDDKDHMMKLQPILANDPAGVKRQHMLDHQRQMQMKAMQAQMRQAQMMGMGGPQQGGPRPGAQSKGPRNQGPPGGIHSDQMASQGGGVVPMPRRPGAGNG